VLLSLYLYVAFSYQLDFITPGIWPDEAYLRRQILHISNLR
jgi:hypothetical protein